MHQPAWLSLCFALVAGSMPAAAETAVTVSFVHPEQYTDAALDGGYGLKAEQPALDEIGRYIKGLGMRYLTSHQVLAVEVTDVDLAGQFEPWRRVAYDVRVLRDVYPPRIKLHYRLAEGERTLIEGEELVVDVNYLANPAVRLIQDPLRYEKAMLSDWFQARFVSAKVATAQK